MKDFKLRLHKLSRLSRWKDSSAAESLAAIRRRWVTDCLDVCAPHKRRCNTVGFPPDMCDCFGYYPWQGNACNWWYGGNPFLNDPRCQPKIIRNLVTCASLSKTRISGVPCETISGRDTETS